MTPVIFLKIIYAVTDFKYWRNFLTRDVLLFFSLRNILTRDVVLFFFLQNILTRDVVLFFFLRNILTRDVVLFFFLRNISRRDVVECKKNRLVMLSRTSPIQFSCKYILT